MTDLLHRSNGVRWLALLTAVWVVSGTAVAQKQPDPSPQATRAEQEARRQAESGQWDQALQAADRILQNQADSVHALVTRGIALNGQEKYDEAIEVFDSVTEVKGRTPLLRAARADAWAHRSRSLYEKREFLEAIDSAYFATLEDGDHLLAHQNRARAYLARRQYDKAIRSATRALRVNDADAVSLAYRGCAYVARGRFNPALKDLDKALAADPDNALALRARGAAHTGKGNLRQASQDVNRALQLQPEMAEALCDRAWLFGLAGNVNRAMEDLERALQLNPDEPRGHLLKGQALLEQKQFAAAARSLSEAIRLDEKNAQAWSYRGYARLGQDRYDDAVQDFTRSIELDEELQLAWEGRSKAWRKLKQRDKAAADLKRVRELSNDSDKDEEYQPERFVVESRPVDPDRRQEALTAARKIDQLVETGYAAYGVDPNPMTGDAQFLRRVYLDITGTIPTYQETRRFLNSREDDKRAALIDELLDSDGYASHSFNYWADVLRYVDRLANDVEGDHYRQWIKQSLAENKPWDSMVQEMLSSEGLIWDSPATGYIQRDAGMPLDNMNNTVRIFLGTRIGCAQCHDHPFDRWTQKEFYHMAAFTFGTRAQTGGGDTRFWEDNPNDRLQAEYEEIEQEEEDRRRNYYRFQRLIRTNMRIVNDRPQEKIRLPDDYAYDNASPGEVVPPKTLFGQPADVQPGESPRKAFARWLTSKDNPRFALTIANRLWKRAFGVGQIEPVDDMMDETEAENPELMAFLESEMKRLDFDMKQFQRMIFNSKTYQRQASTHEHIPDEPYHFAGPILRRMTAEQLWDSFLTLAVADPDEFRERPASKRSEIISADLNSVSAPEMLLAVAGNDDINSNNWRREKKYRYKGALLARASELPSPVPAGHFLRTFGQSSRELIAASSTHGSVPQVLFMFNGPISHMILEKNSTLYNNVRRTRTIDRGVKIVFQTILSRNPDQDEMELARQQIEQKGIPGYGDVIWALVNTREFLFVQ